MKPNIKTQALFVEGQSDASVVNKLVKLRLGVDLAERTSELSGLSLARAVSIRRSNDSVRPWKQRDLNGSDSWSTEMVTKGEQTGGRESSPFSRVLDSWPRRRHQQMEYEP